MSTWTFIDTETDGLYPPVHIIEIAAQKFDRLKPVGDPFRVFINRGVEIPVEATSVHGYTTDFIERNGLNPKLAYDQLRKYVGNDPVSAHYLVFDWDRALNPELVRLKQNMIGQRGFCSWMLSRRVLPEHPTHKLDYLRETYNLACSGPHSALGDVESVTDLLVRIIFPRLASIGYDTLEGIYEFMRLSPAFRCKCLIEGLNYDDEVARLKQTKREQVSLERYINSVLYDSSFDITTLILKHNLIEDAPLVEFEGKTFLFTGKMSWGSRSRIASLIEERGGIFSKSKSITQKINYLVLGEDLEKGWSALLHGGKIASAFEKKLREPDRDFRIILHKIH